MTEKVLDALASILSRDTELTAEEFHGRIHVSCGVVAPYLKEISNKETGDDSAPLSLGLFSPKRTHAPFNTQNKGKHIHHQHRPISSTKAFAKKFFFRRASDMFLLDFSSIGLSRRKPPSREISFSRHFFLAHKRKVTMVLSPQRRDLL